MTKKKLSSLKLCMGFIFFLFLFSIGYFISKEGFSPDFKKEMNQLKKKVLLYLSSFVLVAILSGRN